MRRKHLVAIACVLTAAMSWSPWPASSQQPGAGQAAAGSGGTKVDLSFITPETAVAVVAFPRRVLTSPEMELLPIEVLSAAGKKELGIDPLQIEQMLVIVEAPQAGPPALAVVLRMASPLPQGKILRHAWDETTEAKLEGKTYRQAHNPMGLSIFNLDERTLIVAHDPLLRKLLKNRAHRQEGEMSRILAQVTDPPDVMAVARVEPLRPLIAPLLAQAPLPPPLAGLAKMPGLLSTVGAKLNLTGNMAMSLTLEAKDETAAKVLEQIIDGQLALGRQAMLAEAAKHSASTDPIEQATGKYVQRVGERLLRAVRPVRKGKALTVAGGGRNLQLSALSILPIAGAAWRHAEVGSTPSPRVQINKDFDRGAGASAQQPPLPRRQRP